MEQALFVTQGIIITLILYLNRGRRAENAKTREEARADNAQLRTDMHSGFQDIRAENAKTREEARADNAQLRTDMHSGFQDIRAENAKTREEARADNAQLRTDMDTGFNRICERLDKLTDVVMDLCRRVGRLEGKAEGSTNPDQ